MKRIIALFSVLVMMITCFAGCGKGDTTEKFTVTYNVDGTLSTEKVLSGETAKCTEPTEEGKIFDGWYTDLGMTQKYAKDTPVTADITLYGTMRVQLAEYTVTFMVDGTPYEVKVEEGGYAEFDKPDKDGYIFDGWYKNAECTGDKVQLSAYPITCDTTLYAGFKAIVIPATYTVTFDLDGGRVTTPISIQSVKEGEKAERPTAVPEKDGYEFIGWYLSGAEYDFDQAVAGNLVLVATYKVKLPSTNCTATATSEAEGHTAQLATDGNGDTYWLAEGASATLTLDLGNINEIRLVRQVFNEKAAWQFNVEGSVDGTNWAVIADNSTNETEGDDYIFTANGYFKYVRLNVLNGATASSKEFYIEVFDPNNGSNISLGLKGNADNWGAGYETEKALDGDYSTFWCANDGGYPKFYAVEWTYTVYVRYVDFYFVNEGTFNYEVEARLEDGSWIKLEEANDHEGKNFRLTVEREVNAVLIRQFGGPGWPSVAELNVYGFKNMSALTQKQTQDGYDVYDLGDSYIYGIVSDSETLEYSTDNAQWVSVASGIDGVKKNAKYVRVKEGQSAKIYATPYKNDLARYIQPTASDYSNDGYRPGVATMHPENVWVINGDGGAGHFWCASSWGGQHTLELDFGNICIVDGFKYTFQDEIAENKYKLKIELSADKETWTTVFDNFETGGSGRIFAQDFEAVRARYVKITVEYVDGWTNCKNLQIYGVGAPVRPIEVR